MINTGANIVKLWIDSKKHSYVRIQEAEDKFTVEFQNDDFQKIKHSLSKEDLIRFFGVRKFMDMDV